MKKENNNVIRKRQPPRFLIMKSTRARDSVTARNAYQNRDTCARAGVKPGKIYCSKEVAKADALKLSSVNPVGFVVIQLQKKT